MITANSLSPTSVAARENTWMPTFSELGIRMGTTGMMECTPGTTVWDITFSKPMPSDNYYVLITTELGGEYYSQVRFGSITNKTTDGFTLYIWTENQETGYISAQYLAIMNN